MLISWHPNKSSWKHSLRSYRSGWVSADLTDPRLHLIRIAQVAAKRVWSPCVWKNGIRGKKNFLGADLIAFDFDDGPPLEELKESFQDVICIIGETQNHMKEKRRGNSDVFYPPAPRHRVIGVLENLCEDLATYETTCHRYQSLYGADSTRDGGRLFKPCQNIVHMQAEGDSYEFVKPKPPKPVNLDGLGTRKLTSFHRTCLQIGPPKEWQQKRNILCFKLACDFVKLGFTKEEAVALLWKSKVPISSDQIRLEEITQCVDSAFKNSREAKAVESRKTSSKAG